MVGRDANCFGRSGDLETLEVHAIKRHKVAKVMMMPRCCRQEVLAPMRRRPAVALRDEIVHFAPTRSCRRSGFCLQ